MSYLHAPSWTCEGDNLRTHPRNLTNWYQKLPCLKGVTFSKPSFWAILGIHIRFRGCNLCKLWIFLTVSTDVSEKNVFNIKILCIAYDSTTMKPEVWKKGCILSVLSVLLLFHLLPLLNKTHPQTQPPRQFGDPFQGWKPGENLTDPHGASAHFGGGMSVEIQVRK